MKRGTKVLVKLNSPALILFLFSCFLSACSPHKKFDNTRHPAAPDYSKESSWIALPWRKDIGDTIPPGCTIKEDQQNAKVDVFFIHPTLYIAGNNWNGDLTDKDLNKNDDRCIMVQATAFNACGRLYAPRYRQAHLKAFFNTEEGPKALDLAYEDVKTAFEYYLKNWNKGRPIIIAGHSQGAHHAQRLLKEFFDGKELQKQLVAAYPIGMPISKNEFKTIPLSDSASQTGCFITWNTVAWGTQEIIRKKFYNGSACVNPLNWKSDSTYAPAQLNKGGISFKYKKIDPAVCDAQQHNSLLWVRPVIRKGYYKIGSSYHLCDYAFFYMNIRENALLRANSFLKKK